MNAVRRRSHHARRPAPVRGVLLALVLAVFAAGCQDVTSPTEGLKPQFAQGDGGVWMVNTLGDTDADGCGAAVDDTECTLREAIADATAGGRITFAPELAGPLSVILLTSGQLMIDKDLRIVGPGASDLEIRAQGTSRVFSIFKDGAPSLQVEIHGLQVSGGGGATGGGLYNGESLTLSDVRIIANSSAGIGGGIYTDGDGSLTLLNSMVSNNSANIGGGIAAFGGRVTLIGSSLWQNSSGSGGGAIYTNGAHITILRSTLSDNHSGESGTSGIFSLAGTLNVRSSTIVDAIYARSEYANSEDALTFANSVIGGGCTDVDGTMTSLGFNVLVACSPVTPVTGDILVAAAELFTKVLRPAVATHGGRTLVHALQVGGRAVDAGYCPAETEDQRGSSRPLDYPGVVNAADGCDIGAYELHVPVTDLMVSQGVDKTSVKQGDLLTYTIRVQNRGMVVAPNVVMNDVLSSGVTFFEARSNKGTLKTPPKGENGTVTWTLGDMLPAANEVAEIVVTVLVKGRNTITNTATVTGDVSDPNLANNTASITVSVGAGGSGKTRK